MKSLDNKRTTAIDLSILAAITMLLSFWGGELYYHPDVLTEWAFTAVTHNGNPQFFIYPALTLYLNAAVYLVVFFVLLLFGQVGSYGEFINLYLSKTLIQWPIAVPSYLPGHILTAAFSVVAVLCVYLIVMLFIKQRWIGIAAGVFTAVSPLWVAQSHALTVNIPLAGFAMTAIWYSVRSVVRESLWDLKPQIIAGVLAGLTASAKYNGAVVIVAMYAPMLLLSWKSPLRLAKGLIVVGLSAAIAFLITNPYIIVDFQVFWRDFSVNIANSRHGHQGWRTGMPPAAMTHINTLIRDYGMLPLLLSIGGIIWSFSGRTMNRAAAAALLAFPVLFFVPIGLSRLVFPRYMVPMIPILAVYSALAVHGIRELLFQIPVIQNEKLKRQIITAVIGILLAIAIWPRLAQSINDDIILSRDDTRHQLTLALMHANIDSPLTVFADLYTVEEVFLAGLNLQRLNAGDDIEFLRNEIRRQKTRFRFVGGWANSRTRYSQMDIQNMACESFDLMLFDNISHDRIIRENRDSEGHLTELCSDYDRFDVIAISPHNPAFPRNDGSIRTGGTEYYPGPYIEIYATHELADSLRASMDRQDIAYISAPGSRGYYFRELLMRDEEREGSSTGVE